MLGPREQVVWERTLTAAVGGTRWFVDAGCGKLVRRALAKLPHQVAAEAQSDSFRSAAGLGMSK